MIAAVGVSKSFGVGAGRVEALRSVDIEFSSSGLHALMGESGSGKSTLINLLAGLDVPDAGEIEVNRKRVSELDEAARARHRLEHVSVIFQDNNLIAEMTNIENVALPLWARGQNRAQGRRAAEDALARLGIDQLGDRRPSEVSGGQRQRVGVARALAGGNGRGFPLAVRVVRVARALAGGQRVLLADEPTGALDSANSEELFKVFAALAHEQSMCVVVATHDPIAGRFCDSMTVLRDGQVIK